MRKKRTERPSYGAVSGVQSVEGVKRHQVLDALTREVTRFPDGLNVMSEWKRGVKNDSEIQTRATGSIFPLIELGKTFGAMG